MAGALPFAAARAYRPSAVRRLLDRDGRELPGHLDDSAGASRAAVLVVHDFYGLTEQVRAVTRRLAGEGFVVFAPDLYRGEVATTREGAIALAGTLAWNQVAIELGLAVQALADASGGAPAAILGFAMGGAAALVAAAAVPRLAGAVTFYGIPQDVAITAPAIRVQGHFAARDGKCTPPRVAALDADLGARRIAHDFFTYDADNGFVDPTRIGAYAPAAAELAWSRTLTFLHEVLP